jgi:hypothetical protein
VSIGCSCVELGQSVACLGTASRQKINFRCDWASTSCDQLQPDVIFATPGPPGPITISPSSDSSLKLRGLVTLVTWGPQGRSYSWPHDCIAKS